MIIKERGGTWKQSASTLLAGLLVERHPLQSPSSDVDWVAAQGFQELMLRLDARPAMHAGHLQEAH